MNQPFNEFSKISEIVTEFPKASDLFKTYRIDFCCGGNRPLIEAIEEKKLSKDEILSKLNTLYHEKKLSNEVLIDFKEASSSDLIEHIVTNHHRFLNEELPLLSPYVTKVMRVHGETQPHLVRLHKLFFDLKTELEAHTWKEETTDFKLILEYEQNPTDENYMKLNNVVGELENEHSSAGDILKELREITNDYTPPKEACGTYRLVYQRLEALEADTFQHIHLENNILLKRAIVKN
ncbi:iron-sulfur cluster repair di-iron protein [Bacillus sp. AFS053548]|uniref:iron-sulfur cluster repair di-iron protein n=1 Tax=Bacillus sp. AFS053548 TaxID=2033505 RepID=UPI000BFC8189|nr:iron-sulfur cluster repair di-iron protein [Bacillus sp. AFS053548]PGM54168.1 iron-sulfur cluster repair di-iron protein [Bacillus sp. AFS053548]